jgi:biopolymer transport protein ExbB
MVAIEKFIYFNIHERTNFNKIRPELKKALEQKDMKDVMEFLDKNKGSTSKAVKEILIFLLRTKTDNMVRLEEKAREVGLAQVAVLEKKMWILSLVAHTTPLLGLLGTVLGMIKAFQAVALHGTGDASVLATGISQALITTAGGLFVAIPALVVYNYFNRKIDEIINDMEKGSTEVINYFRK